jgi:hypothetical protein
MKQENKERRMITSMQQATMSNKIIFLGRSSCWWWSLVPISDSTPGQIIQRSRLFSLSSFYKKERTIKTKS